MSGADDGPASWEVMLTPEELRIAAFEDGLPEWTRPEDLCRNCRLPKKLRSSRRCFACEKYHQRHGVERPRDLIDKEILRDWA